MTTIIAPSIATPSIAASAMLVDFSTSAWEANKTDKKATAEVLADNHAAAGAAKVQKKLMEGCPEHSAIIKFRANARTMHYSMTMPWADTGVRLLPTQMYFKYNDTMGKLREEFYQLVDKFIMAYEWRLVEVESQLGNLFKRDDYPSTDKVRRKFAFTVSYMPVPERGDWRVDINAQARSALTEHYEDFYQRKIASAMTDIWEKLYEPLARMSERLDYGDTDDKKIFRDSLVENVNEMIDTLALCNITNDPAMEAARSKLHNAMRDVTPDALRASQALRQRTKQTVDEIIANLPGLGM